MVSSLLNILLRVFPNSAFCVPPSRACGEGYLLRDSDRSAHLTAISNMPETSTVHLPSVAAQQANNGGRQLKKVRTCLYFSSLLIFLLESGSGNVHATSSSHTMLMCMHVFFASLSMLFDGIYTNCDGSKQRLLPHHSILLYKLSFYHILILYLYPSHFPHVIIIITPRTEYKI